MSSDRIEKKDIQIIILLIITVGAIIASLFIYPYLIALIAFVAYYLIYYWMITLSILGVIICINIYHRYKIGKKLHISRSSLKYILIIIIIIVFLPILFFLYGTLIGIWVNY